MTYSELEHAFALEAKAAGHEVVVMTMCPFCGGPPSLIYRTNLADSQIDGFFEAYVFCHDCGAQSAEVDEYIEIPRRQDWMEEGDLEGWQADHKKEMAAHIKKAIENWNKRDARGASCYTPALETIYINDDAQEVRLYDWLRERGYEPHMVAKKGGMEQIEKEVP